MNYMEKYNTAEWQKFRDKIYKRDNYTCVLCGENQSQMHCHHIAYITGKEPWDYPDYYMQTLCNKCHSERSELLKNAYTKFMFSISKIPNERLAYVVNNLAETAMLEMELNTA